MPLTHLEFNQRHREAHLRQPQPPFSSAGVWVSQHCSHWLCYGYLRLCGEGLHSMLSMVDQYFLPHCDTWCGQRVEFSQPCSAWRTRLIVDSKMIADNMHRLQKIGKNANHPPACGLHE